MATTRAQLAHLLRRATFGPRADEVDAAERAGLDATLDALLAPGGTDAGAARTPVPDLGADPVTTGHKIGGKNSIQPQDKNARVMAQQQRRDQTRAATGWWLDRLVQADHQALEKLTFFWHGHWATSVTKVRNPALMLTQRQTLATHGTGDFGVLLKAMLRDPALILWLDGERNTSQAPNENLARELMELFTLGIGSYTEADVRQAARALTGWRVDRAAGTASFEAKRHDAGTKTILGRTGAFDADGLADVLLTQPAHAPFLAGRIWYRYASGDPMPAATRDRLVAAYRPNRDVTALLRAALTDPAFPATAGRLVKQPVEWAVGAMRQLGVRPGELTAQQRRQLLGHLDDLGQLPFAPPNVGGWPADAAWLTTSAAEVKVRTATFLAERAAPDVLATLGAVPDAQRPDVLARLLVVDGFTARSRGVLATAKDPRKLLALGLASPEYAVM